MSLSVYYAQIPVIVWVLFGRIEDVGNAYQDLGGRGCYGTTTTYATFSAKDLGVSNSIAGDYSTSD
jgi:hypothetical protein